MEPLFLWAWVEESAQQTSHPNWGGQSMSRRGASSPCSTNGILIPILSWDPAAFHFAQMCDRRGKLGNGPGAARTHRGPLGAGDPGAG
jgi:hypothetical protein